MPSFMCVNDEWKVFGKIVIEFLNLKFGRDFQVWFYKKKMRKPLARILGTSLQLQHCNCKLFLVLYILNVRVNGHFCLQ